MNEREEFEPSYSPQYLAWKTDFIAKNNAYPSPCEAWQAALHQQGEPICYVRRDELSKAKRVGPILAKLFQEPAADRSALFTSPPQQQGEQTTHNVEAGYMLLKGCAKLALAGVTVDWKIAIDEAEAMIAAKP